LLVALGMTVAFWLPARDATAQAREPLATIITVGGHAEIFRRSTETWTDATLRDEVTEGDGVRTRSGRLTLRVSSGEVLRLGPRTQVFLSADGEAPAGGRPRARLDGGRLWLAVRSTSPVPVPIDVGAGIASVTTRGGGISIEINPDGSVRIGVAHGSATVEGREWTRALAQDRELIVPAAGAAGRLGAVKRGQRDAEWMKWNEQQDQAGGYGARRAE
jgi:hypothetical protein